MSNCKNEFNSKQNPNISVNLISINNRIQFTQVVLPNDYLTNCSDSNPKYHTENKIDIISQNPRKRSREDSYFVGWSSFAASPNASDNIRRKNKYSTPCMLKQKQQFHKSYLEVTIWTKYATDKTLANLPSSVRGILSTFDTKETSKEQPKTWNQKTPEQLQLVSFTCLITLLNTLRISVQWECK